MRTARRTWQTPLFAVAVLGLAVTPLAGQETDDREWKAPHKNGHTFSPALGVPDAFVRSYIRTNVGLSNTFDVDIPLGVVGSDTLFASRGSLLFALLGLEYQQTIKDWIAFRAAFKVNGRLGTGTSALLASGVSASTGFELGWLMRLLETDKSYLSLSFDVRKSDFTTINIADFVEDVIDGEDAELVGKTPSMRAGAGVRFTHAFSPLIGLVSFLETGYGESVDRTKEDEWFTRFGATVDFDLAAVNWLPVGLAAGYSQDSFPEGGADITDVVRTILFRIGYTGREDLNLGLNFRYASFPTESLDTKIKSTGVDFDIRYFF
ncbi:MAG: hypothetical protein M8866_01745 [marine benthic group bacterium]|jgi:hypothetical protein|nr:hypothetical protein [Candidatus Benthicola marisminoris]